MRQPGEPSVEDILVSIKKVIARDAPADPPPDAAAAEDEVLDLATSAHMVEEADAPDAPDEADDAAMDAPPLLAPERREGMRESLAALAILAQPGAAPRIVRSGETSLEGLTRELLRPALAEWLDQNLPAMVERLVSAEIARIVGKKR